MLPRTCGCPEVQTYGDLTSQALRPVQAHPLPKAC
jgi:hypothetical protein